MINATSCPKPLKDYQALRPYGENVLTTIGKEWKKHRHICNPGFTDQTLKLLCKILERSTQSYLQNIKACFSGKEMGERDILVDMKKLTFDSIVNVGFGLKVDSFSSQQKENFEFKGTYKSSFAESLSESLVQTIFYVAVVPSWCRTLLRKLPFSNFGKRIEQKTHEAGRRIEEIINYKTKNSETLNKYDVISGLLKAEGITLTTNEIKSNIYIILFAGHDTISTTISWCLYELAKNPHIQKKAREYIKRQVGNKFLDFELMNELTYITQIVKETLRFHTAVPIITKRVVKKIKLGKHTIRKGQYITINIRGIHHDPRYWEKPEIFNPERFEKKPKAGSYIPFSSGSRKCLGFNFAYVEGTMLLASLLRQYEFSFLKNHKKVKAVQRVTLQPDNLKLKLTVLKN